MEMVCYIGGYLVTYLLKKGLMLSGSASAWQHSSLGVLLKVKTWCCLNDLARVSHGVSRFYAAITHLRFNNRNDHSCRKLNQHRWVQSKSGPGGCREPRALENRQTSGGHKVPKHSKEKAEAAQEAKLTDGMGLRGRKKEKDRRKSS